MCDEKEPEIEYKSLLETFGFSFKGDCQVCGGRAWLFQRKTSVSEVVEVKLRKCGKNFTLEKKRIVNGKIPTKSGYGFTKGNKKHIALVLERNGIHAEASV